MSLSPAVAHLKQKERLEQLKALDEVLRSAQTFRERLTSLTDRFLRQRRVAVARTKKTIEDDFQRATKQLNTRRVADQKLIRLRNLLCSE